MLKRSFVALLGVAVLALPGAALAQSVTGQVTDNTGGVLPGVTVEASSEALIEGSRIAITDGQGRYNIVALAIGTYSVAFTLSGFSTTLVEEVGIEGQAALTVDAIMEVGALEETVTVSGAAPQVDVQTTATAEVLDREMLDAIPTGRNLQSTAQLNMGITAYPWRENESAGSRADHCRAADLHVRSRHEQPADDRSSGRPARHELWW